jgi:hypothetical protein
MRICYSDTFTGEDDWVDVPSAEFGPQAVNVALSRKMDPDGDWRPEWVMESWVTVGDDGTACFIMRDVNPTHDPMLVHGVVYMQYDPNHTPR